MITNGEKAGRWFQSERLKVLVSEDRETMGRAAAQHVIEHLEGCLSGARQVRVIFGCAPSQDEFLAALVEQGKQRSFPWGRLEVFHMDEYVGLGAADDRSFRNYLKRHLLDHVEVGRFHPIEGDARDVEAMTRAYAAELGREPIDLICMGVGENGHVAFNDPPVADFEDPLLVKVIDLDPVCRQQQVNDGCFATLPEVPATAVTITVPVFLKARALSCVVPNERKAEAVRRTLEDPIGPACPSTLLRLHPDARLYVEPKSFAKITEDNLTRE